MTPRSNENTDMLLNAAEAMEAHWDQHMGGAEFKLGDETTLAQFTTEIDELHQVSLATEKAADALELAQAHEMEVAGRVKKKILGYPIAVENKEGPDSVAMQTCPYLAHQRKRRRRRTTGGATTGGGTTTVGTLPADVK